MIWVSYRIPTDRLPSGPYRDNAGVELGCHQPTCGEHADLNAPNLTRNVSNVASPGALHFPIRRPPCYRYVRSRGLCV